MTFSLKRPAFLYFKKICDAIKQNESEVSQIQFSYFWLTVYVIYKVTFYNKPHLKLVS